jgi:hypothetical protein
VGRGPKVSKQPSHGVRGMSNTALHQVQSTHHCCAQPCVRRRAESPAITAPAMFVHTCAAPLPYLSTYIHSYLPMSSVHIPSIIPAHVMCSPSSCVCMCRT